MAGWRVKVTFQFSSTKDTSTVVANINDVLSAYPEVTGGPCTRSGTTVNLDAEAPESIDIDAFRTQMTAAWAVGTRGSEGKFSISKIGDL